MLYNIGTTKMICLVHLFYSGFEYNPVPEIIDSVFAKTNPKRSFSMTENGRFGLVFAKTGSINSGNDPGRLGPFLKSLLQNCVSSCV